MIYTKKGFTLFEIIIVLVLIGLFFVMTSYMTRDPRINQTRTERLVNTVYDQIRTARNNMIIGRGVASGAILVVTTQRSIDITSTGVVTNYIYNTTSTGTETRLVTPFFDRDPLYKITNIAASSGVMVPGALNWDISGATNASITISSNSDVSLSSIPASPYPIRLLKVTLGYGDFEQSVIIDRVSGIVEIRKAIED
ncbi:prepilin-type N-terminal cleavage/methylation domain-containing protein [Candidatus Gracilibacteria bacterium]|nr:prepilin-type N-terminal cleavage/methylation domain-containing protein [Candidatus Gracilibacteria bacterium]